MDCLLKIHPFEENLNGFTALRNALNEYMGLPFLANEPTQNWLKAFNQTDDIPLQAFHTLITHNAAFLQELGVQNYTDFMDKNALWGCIAEKMQLDVLYNMDQWVLEKLVCDLRFFVTTALLSSSALTQHKGWKECLEKVSVEEFSDIVGSILKSFETLFATNTCTVQSKVFNRDDVWMEMAQRVMKNLSCVCAPHDVAKIWWTVLQTDFNLTDSLGRRHWWKNIGKMYSTLLSAYPPKDLDGELLLDLLKTDFPLSEQTIHWSALKVLWSNMFVVKDPPYPESTLKAMSIVSSMPTTTRAQMIEQGNVEWSRTEPLLSGMWSKDALRFFNRYADMFTDQELTKWIGERTLDSSLSQLCDWQTQQKLQKEVSQTRKKSAGKKTKKI